MKTNLFKSILFTALAVTLFGSCTKDDDYNVQSFKPMIFSEDFVFNPANTLADRGWITYAEAGTKNWDEGEYSHDAYAEFTSYQSPDALNVAWLITPAINMDNHSGEKLLFQIAQAYVSSGANSIEVLISSDFDGNPANVLTSTWTPLDFTHPTLDYNHNFVYVNSEIDLSAFTGNVHIAFKVKGSGTNTSLDGTYQVDNVRVIY